MHSSHKHEHKIETQRENKTLVTIEEFKNFAQINTKQNDELIGSLIENSIMYLEEYFRVIFVPATTKEYFYFREKTNLVSDSFLNIHYKKTKVRSCCFKRFFGEEAVQLSFEQNQGFLRLKPDHTESNIQSIIVEYSHEPISNSAIKWPIIYLAYNIYKTNITKEDFLIEKFIQDKLSYLNFNSQINEH